jgi:tetratricopeptide (TPR) repeat protein
MLKRLGVRLVASSLLLSVAALAAPKTAPAAAGVRRDPHGVKGISPFQEALKKGDNALIARDFEAAIAAYREAIASEPENALGQYRLGEAEIAKADLAEADAAFAAGLRFVGADAPLKAKLLFAQADVRERQKAYDEAISKWTEYQTQTSEQKESKGFPASAVERKRVLEAWKKLSADSAAVKARIEKRLKEADDSVRKSSK